MIIPRHTLWKGFLLFLYFYLITVPMLGEIPVKEFPNKMKYDAVVEAAARKYDIPAELIHSIIQAESNYNLRAVSPKGAKGLMQLMPVTAKIYGVQNVFDPRENIEGGVKYLRDLIKLYRRDTGLVLAAYNAGQEAVKKYGGIPPYPETRDYIKRVMSTYSRATIRTRTIIYQYYDESGRLVLTNSPYLYALNKNNDN